MAKCGSCGADVIFVPSAKSGKRMILDAKPSKGVLLQELPAHAGANVVTRRSEYGQPSNVQALVSDVYTDHHATCPRSKDWHGHSRANPPSLLHPDAGHRAD